MALEGREEMGLRKTLGGIRRADRDWNMIEDNDRIAVGVSGGKDSMLLLYALHLYRRFSRRAYSLEAITLEMGFEPFDVTPIRAFCREIGVSYRSVPTQIAQVVFEHRKEKNPCALCAKMRRGVLHDAAKAAGCNKLALGHTRDDALETLLLSLLYEGRFNVFSPVTYLDRKDITVIRPMVYLSEEHVRNAVRQQSLPIVVNPCPANGHTKRQEMKELLALLGGICPDSKDKLQNALMRHESYNLWDRERILETNRRLMEARRGL
ncbi:MAG: tRNA 2-thiocytidine biosynthesis TtcA family protein [Christensenellales bacterium]